ncbi:NAD(P)/FAD-dependent oxidoreductase [Synechococcus sp. CS-602]|uniref:NAD(P)/FAD-dependent oxidoreductase n=1 Tax=Synechococcaceae TaxID=1890426 RepID=UPI0008FF596E|nr:MULTISPECIES: FAD/NAD(P)-binding oxidoreductase [Synechococcaceae]MCT4363291.1 NAD(P)/FAD-dependent oxidoreductase [Candidatus Regnicoccus frigidus MAG-AL1]APD47150.1 pyridine nucleotide-disulfide oxidoreductase [Synechococcus sp. SynAce01]MCT0202020.1 NAD(P)/FAD-dependent oxidoreductase [Synechococcus sp. CS-603]MCT0205016.1 NAD(P)/FAD-dependent oxidoreductase [Synechococcus sp. CS-602]MCT0246220.1 NAD(P)/FAD-dependent oxidoreductase [Synechococcus sp. CS-601]
MAESASSARHFQVLIVGGGSGGLIVAAQLLRARPGLDLAILEPAAVHEYQSGWIPAGAGLLALEQTHRSEASVIPAGAVWIQGSAASFEPQARRVITAAGEALSYDVLVVAMGLQLNWSQIKGLPEALGSYGIISNYSRAHIATTWEAIRSFKGGTAVFSHPATPIKCGGAPQKVMYLADDIFQATSGVGVNARVIFCTALAHLYPVKAYNATVERVVARRGIETRLLHNLIEVRAEEQLAIFEVSSEGKPPQQEAIHFDLLHVVPPMSAPDVMAASPLAIKGPGGWVDVNRLTCQHKRFADVFALGDVSSLPTSKSLAAIRGQAPVLVANLLAQLDAAPLPAQYDGYTACPLITGFGRVVMAEFDYQLQPVSSFLVDPTKERWSMWLVETRVFPWVYWNRVLKGRLLESRFIKPLAPLVRWLGLAHQQP